MKRRFSHSISALMFILVCACNNHDRTMPQTTPPLQTNATPNQMAMATCDTKPMLVVVSSGEHLLQRFTFADSAWTEREPIRFEQREQRSAQPFGIHIENRSPIALVTLFGQHAISLVDVCEGTILDDASFRTADHRLEVPDGITSISIPFDLDADGQKELSNTVFTPLSPQHLTKLGDHYYVVFSGFVHPSGPNIQAGYAPSVLSKIHISDDLRIDISDSIILDGFNAQYVQALPERSQLAVSHSGRLHFENNSWRNLDASGITIYDLDLNMVSSTPFDETMTLGPIAVTASTLFVGDLLGRRIFSLDLRTPHLPPQLFYEVASSQSLDSIFALTQFAKRIYWGSFADGRVSSLDTEVKSDLPDTHEWQPTPTSAPIGLQQLQIYDIDGSPTLFGLYPISHEIWFSPLADL